MMWNRVLDYMEQNGPAAQDKKTITGEQRPEEQSPAPFLCRPTLLSLGIRAERGAETDA
jgi:hypothetical protein